MNWTDKCMTVGDLIEALSFLDPNLKVVVPDAPYGQPNELKYIGGVLLSEDDPDTGVKAGMYIGINMGKDFDEDDEPETIENIFPSINAWDDVKEEVKEEPINTDSYAEFIDLACNAVKKTI